MIALAPVLFAGCALFGPEPERQPGFGLSDVELSAAIAEVGLGADADILIAETRGVAATTVSVSPAGRSWP